MLFLLTGKPNSGKDHASKYLSSQHGFTQFAFADKIREYLLILNPAITGRDSSGKIYAYSLRSIVDDYGWDEAKRQFPEVRRLLQVLGTEIFREKVGKDYWVDLLIEEIQKEKPPGDVVISDWRFWEEYVAINPNYTTDSLGYYGVFRVRILGGKCSQEPPDTLLHSSETQDLAVDLTVNNDGTVEEFHEKLDRLVKVTGEIGSL